jgi:threonine aldolase
VSGTATPAELTWKAGVDVLSFGATKNGALGAEAVVLFDTGLAEALMYRRMRGGHLVSKGRFIAAQLEAYLKDDLWLALARHANAMARRLADGIEGSSVARLAHPVPANEVFAILPRDADTRLKAAGAIYHEWIWDKPADMGEDEIMIRLVTAFATEQDEVDRFLTLLG